MSGAIKRAVIFALVGETVLDPSANIKFTVK